MRGEASDEIGVRLGRDLRAGRTWEARDVKRIRSDEAIEDLDHERLEVYGVLEAVAHKCLDGVRVAPLVGPPEEDGGIAVGPGD